jgi:hypothetical protein
MTRNYMEPRVTVAVNGSSEWIVGDGEHPPDLTLTVSIGMDSLTYRLCRTCWTLQTRIESADPVVCEDCAAVVEVER